MSCFFKMLFPGPSGFENFSYGRTIIIDNKLPCSFYENRDGGKPKSRLLLYFHGNAEDATVAGGFIDSFMTCLDAHAAVVEYPTYGEYKDCKELTEERIFEDSVRAYNYFKTALNLDSNQIIICGRSIGSGASTYLASRVDSLGFILISPLAAVDMVVIDKLKFIFKMTWKFWAVLTTIMLILGCFHSWYWLKGYGFFLLLLSVFIAIIYCSLRKFRNIERIGNVSQPTIIIHGKADDVIECYHSKVLIENSAAQNKTIHLFKEMTHNQIDPVEHLETPIKEFFQGLLKKYPFGPINIRNLPIQNEP
jgi:esterase/lipase